MTMIAEPETMRVVMSRDEMEARFQEEWVLISEPYLSPQTHRVESGVVLWHGSDRDEAWRLASLLPIPRRIGVFYFGQSIHEGRYCL